MASWILTPPGDLTGDDRAALARITARCAELNATRDLVGEFADMLCRRRGEHLEAWASRAEGRPGQRAAWVQQRTPQRLAAVTAGFTVPHSSGAVEGHVNRIIKMIKRQMYSRAKPDLLRILWTIQVELQVRMLSQVTMDAHMLAGPLRLAQRAAARRSWATGSAPHVRFR